MDILILLWEVELNVSKIPCFKCSFFSTAPFSWSISMGLVILWHWWRCASISVYLSLHSIEWLFAYYCLCWWLYCLFLSVCTYCLSSFWYCVSTYSISNMCEWGISLTLSINCFVNQLKFLCISFIIWGLSITMNFAKNMLKRFTWMGQYLCLQSWWELSIIMWRGSLKFNRYSSGLIFCLYFFTCCMT